MIGYRPQLAVTLFAVPLWFGASGLAGACTCISGWPTLEQASRTSDVVIVGRITTQTKLENPRPYEGQAVAYVDVLVTESLKGPVPGATIRVWDAGFGSSCSVDLRPLAPGTTVAFALEQNKTKYRDYQRAIGLKVAPEDYLLVACGTFHRLLSSDEEAAGVAAKIRRALRKR